MDRKILSTIIEKYDGGPVGIETLSAAVSEEKDTLEDVYEPYLIQVGFLNRTPRGRVATESRRMILSKLAEDGQVLLPGDVAEYILKNVRRDVPSLLDALEKVSRYALSESRKITLRLAREVLGRCCAGRSVVVRNVSEEEFHV